MLDLDALVERAAEARVVMLGEATHGTHEFYETRARITERLVAEHGFRIVAVEGDWPDCVAVDRFVRSPPGGPVGATAALRAFERWPTWMWANREVARFIETLRERNWNAPPGDRVGFYGLDVYSLWDSLSAVERYLDEHAPGSVEAARRAFRCFEPYARDEQAYASATTGFVPASCEREVVALLAHMAEHPMGAGEAPRDDPAFDAEQNALVAKNAELYYRTMMRGGAESWNVRDRHMQLTLERLLERRGPDAKAVVWAHNTHVGDARATDMAAAGMTNLGQLARERWGRGEVCLVGFGTHRGSVVAGAYWGAPMRRVEVPAAWGGSWEARLAGRDRVLLGDELPDEELPHRAIGVVYDPHAERWGNYVPTVPRARYDAFVFLDETRALDPLHVPVDWHAAAETWPTGF